MYNCKNKKNTSTIDLRNIDKKTNVEKLPISSTPFNTLYHWVWRSHLLFRRLGALSGMEVDARLETSGFG